MNDYLKMSIEDLEKLKKEKININNFKLNPYYKDNVSCLKIVVNDISGYIVTKVTPNDKWMGIYQFYTETIDFLKYYKVCSKSDWEDALNRLNVYFKDASLEVKEL